MILKDKENQLHILVKHFKLQNDNYNHKLYETFVDIDKDFETINKIHIDLIINSSILSYSFLSLYHLKDKTIDNAIVKALEISISANALYALNYALYIKCAQFELGEAAIATNSFYSFNYAKYVLNGPFLLGEKVIASNLGNSLCYSELIGTRFELGEPIIAMCSSSSERYVNKILKKDFYLDDKLVCEYTANLDKPLLNNIDLGLSFYDFKR